MQELSISPKEMLSETIASQARSYAGSALAPATRAAYRGDWTAFCDWCEGAGLEALPAAPATVASYLAARLSAGARVSTVERALCSIAVAHRAAGESSPRDAVVVQHVLRGARRVHGVAPRQVAPLVDLDRVLAVCGVDLLGLRDRALLLVGWVGALRRSEIVALNVDDLTAEIEGVRVQIRRSKTDQEGKGRYVGIPHGTHPGRCPVLALRAWLEAAQIIKGPVFRRLDRGRPGASTRLGARSVASIVQRRVAEAGLDPSKFSGHSLRAGFVTAAARAGVREADIMRQTGHQSAPVMRRYLRPATIWQSNAAIGLV